MSLLKDTRKKLSEKYHEHEDELDPDHDEDIHIKAAKLKPDEFREVLRLGMKHYKASKMEGAPGGEGPARGTDERPYYGRSDSEDIMDRGHRESYDDDDDDDIYGDHS